jgi:ribosomal protein L33
MNRQCVSCNKQIPPARLEAVPKTKYCVNCAKTHVQRPIAYQIWNDKNTPELMVITEYDEKTRDLVLDKSLYKIKEQEVSPEKSLEQIYLKDEN